MSGSGFSVKQTQGDEATFTFGGVKHTIKVVTLQADGISLSIDNKSKVPLKENQGKEIDVNNDKVGDVAVTLKKIDGGRAEMLYKMLIKPAPKAEENKTVESQAAAVQEPTVQVTESLPPKKNNWFRFVILSGSAFAFAAYMVLRKTRPN